MIELIEFFCNKRCAVSPCKHQCEYVSSYLEGIRKCQKDCCSKCNHYNELKGYCNFSEDFCNFEKFEFLKRG